MPVKRKWRILNVDDNEAGRYAVTKTLKKAGFEVIEAANGTDALTLAADQHPDLVLLDVNLPDISGFEVCKRLKHDEKTAAIPVVHLSATFVHTRERVQGLEGGADGYLVHPIEPEELVATIRSFIRIKKTEIALRESETELRTHQIELEIQAEELKKIHLELEESRDKYLDLYEFAPLGYLMLTDKALISEVNLSGATLFGIERSKLVKARFSKFIAKTDSDEWYGYFVNVLNHEEKQTCTLMLKRGDDSSFPARLESIRITGKGDGPPAVRVAISDITDIRQTEEKIKTSETRYRRLFESAKDGILILNRETSEIIDANPFIKTVTGYAKKELIGKKLWDIGFFKDQFASKIAFEELQTKDYIRYEDLPLETKDGKMIEVEFISNVYPIDQNLSVIQCNIRDITDRKAMERQREALIRELAQKNAELARFTYTVSHELRSPLITIQGFAGLVEEETVSGGNPAELRNHVRRIIAAVDTLDALLTALLKLSRAGRSINTPEPIGFGTIVGEALALFARPLAEYGIHVEIDPDFPVVNVDHARIREVLVNLIENAIKYRGNRQDPLIRIGIDTKGDVPVFFVQDNGIGIEPRYLERIFNLFEKLDGTLEGTGVGLAIVKQIIEVHGGKIRAESEGLGKGTTFRFTLPGAGSLDTNANNNR